MKLRQRNALESELVALVLTNDVEKVKEFLQIAVCAICIAKHIRVTGEKIWKKQDLQNYLRH
ncbi:hypothetical protein [Helicobacter japonicus]|uniref:Uncharacterized protein n=1 Tax=Helicobacter japonicus TaxID=425400 RepID=A0A4U8TNI9_9HELI|nr:hypothetical protein [Helicobacter japonicus]TLE01924.1 hypothetical protein LS65_005015 [Helicobacter japonicus]